MRSSRPTTLIVMAALMGLLGLAGCATHRAVGPRASSLSWCGGNAAARDAARANASGLTMSPVNLFGRPEPGWAIYAPLVEDTVKTGCAADTPGFAAAVADWQEAQGFSATGVVDAAALAAMKAGWQARRPFLAIRARGVCPDAPPPAALEMAAATEVLGDKPIRLRRGALEAYRRMIAAARAEGVVGAADAQTLRLFSGYRDPAADAARCAVQANCQGLVRAACSAHRTGLALDLNLGEAQGYKADSADDANRLYQSRTLAYRWLVRNAPRFGFVNYPFEPWHWEWTGEAP